MVLHLAKHIRYKIVGLIKSTRRNQIINPGSRSSDYLNCQRSTVSVVKRLIRSN